MDEDVTDEEISFYIAHEKTCEQLGHKAPTWETLEKDPLTKPLADSIKERLLRAIKSAE